MHNSTYEKKGVKVRLVSGYAWLRKGIADETTTRQTELAEVSRKGKILFFVEPYGEGYNYEDGLFCRLLTEGEFYFEYSREYVKRKDKGR